MVSLAASIGRSLPPWYAVSGDRLDKCHVEFKIPVENKNEIVIEIEYEIKHEIDREYEN